MNADEKLLSVFVCGHLRPVTRPVNMSKICLRLWGAYAILWALREGD